MRSIRNAILAYGLVNVPVGVATAAKRKEPTFRTLHAECGKPIKQSRWCGTCGVELHSEDLVKGFEYAKNTYVVIPEEDLDRLETARSGLIKVSKFIPYDEMSELAVERSYYLTPNDKLAKPYVLLSRAMRDGGVIGIGSQSLWGKETPSMVWTLESGAIAFSPLFCNDEIEPDTDIVSVASATEITDEEYGLARDYVTAATRHLDPEKDLVSVSRETMESYLIAKVADEEFTMPEPESVAEPTVDLMERLRESVARVGELVS